MDGKGNQALGAPNLTDRVWRFDGSLEGIRHTIAYGVNAPGVPETRNAVMPAFADQLDETEIKKLAVYVHRLGGGQ
jgi:cytochrome c oxidase cbb3-type subunit 3